MPLSVEQFNDKLKHIAEVLQSMQYSIDDLLDFLSRASVSPTADKENQSRLQKDIIEPRLLFLTEALGDVVNDYKFLIADVEDQKAEHDALVKLFPPSVVSLDLKPRLEMTLNSIAKALAYKVKHLQQLKSPIDKTRDILTKMEQELRPPSARSFRP